MALVRADSPKLKSETETTPTPRCEYANAVDKGLGGGIGVKATDKGLTGEPEKGQSKLDNYVLKDE